MPFRNWAHTIFQSKDREWVAPSPRKARYRGGVSRLLESQTGFSLTTKCGGGGISMPSLRPTLERVGLRGNLIAQKIAKYRKRYMGDTQEFEFTVQEKLFTKSSLFDLPPVPLLQAL